MTGVRRNQLKRRLREMARLQLLAPLRGSGIQALDVVIRARYEAYAADFAGLRAEMESVRARLALSASSEGPRRKGRD
jgi:ribonuclease P protein component